MSDDYENPFAFTGKIAKVTIDLIDGNEPKGGKDAIVKEEADALLKNGKSPTRVGVAPCRA